MGKKFFGVIAFAAIAVAAGWNYQQNKQEVELSDLALANIEALARYEDDECPNGCLTEYDEKGCWCYRYYPNVKKKTGHVNKKIALVLYSLSKVFVGRESALTSF